MGWQSDTIAATQMALPTMISDCRYVGKRIRRGDKNQLRRYSLGDWPTCSLKYLPRND